MKAEDQNFTLSNQLNELSKKSEKLQERISAVKAQLRLVEGDTGKNLPFCGSRSLSVQLLVVPFLFNVVYGNFDAFPPCSNPRQFACSEPGGPHALRGKLVETLREGLALTQTSASNYEVHYAQVHDAL